jgi:hypothetical protein
MFEKIVPGYWFIETQQNYVPISWIIRFHAEQTFFYLIQIFFQRNFKFYFKIKPHHTISRFASME